VDKRKKKRAVGPPRNAHARLASGQEKQTRTKGLKAPACLPAAILAPLSDGIQ
jgi:hypothetical protein